MLGCGLMGAALACTLAGAGHCVAVWNQTLGDLGFAAQAKVVALG